MSLDNYRKQIDDVDSQLLRIFKQRMDICHQIAGFKKENGLPLYDASREREKLAALGEEAGDDMRSYSHMLFSYLFELSRAYQGTVLTSESQLTLDIKNAIEQTDSIFPANALVACQGVEGAFSQIACDRLFPQPSIFYFSSFEGVFSAVRDELCRYGVLPMENSTAGSVNLVYDLMMKYRFKIVRSVRLKVDHNLLAKEGTVKSGIREIFSHVQAIDQCAEYLRGFGKDVKITAVANTAEAAQLVASSERTDIAALASRSCSKLYGLTCIESSVQDKGSNYTRFICISKTPEIYPGADRTSIMLTTAHKPGALYRVLGLIYSLGINIVKLESRPIPDLDFEFMFYFDLEVSVYSDTFIRLMYELESMCEEFHYLGSYSEII